MQVRASFFAVGGTFAIEKVANERCLVSGETFSAAEEIEKDVTVIGENGADAPGTFGDGEITSVLLWTAAAAVVEEYGGKRARASGFPEVGFEVEIAAGDFDGFGSGWLRILAEAGCAEEQQSEE